MFVCFVIVAEKAKIKSLMKQTSPLSACMCQTREVSRTGDSIVTITRKKRRFSLRRSVFREIQKEPFEERKR